MDHWQGVPTRMKAADVIIVLLIATFFGIVFFFEDIYKWL
jgi:hypothetical protein